MGSISRMNRCDRFIKTVGPTLLKKYQQYDYQKGDWLELVDVNVAQAEDGTEVVKLYLTFRNKRTGDEHQLTQDLALFEPEGEDHDNVSVLASELCDDVDQETYEKSVSKAVKLLKKADLITPKYSIEEEVA
jgi:uncharacterized membrane protein YvbJ